MGRLCIFIHQARTQVLIQTTPIDTYSDWLVIFQCDFNHLRKLGITLFPGIFSIFCTSSFLKE